MNQQDMNKKGVKWIIYRSNQDHNPVPIFYKGFSHFRIDHYDSHECHGYAWQLYRDNPAPRYHDEMRDGNRVFHEYVADRKAALLWYLENFEESRCMDFVTGKIRYEKGEKHD